MLHKKIIENIVIIKDKSVEKKKKIYIFLVWIQAHGQGEIELRVKLHHSCTPSKSFDSTYPIF